MFFPAATSCPADPFISAGIVLGDTAGSGDAVRGSEVEWKCGPRLDILQFNAQTLGEGGEELEASGRSTYLDEIFFQRGVNVAILQECRSSGPRIREQNNFHVVTGGCAKLITSGKATRQQGCEIWIAKEYVDHEGVPRQLAASAIVMRHADARI